MATKAEKEKLVEVLKWTPRTYNISIYGYGGEIAMGKIDRATVDHFRENKISVENYATSWDDDGDEFDVPEELQPFTPGSWYDCDNIEHCSGPEFGGATIEVRDENGEVVWEQELGHSLEDQGCTVECFCDEQIDEYCNDEQAVFVGQSFEKGTFFDGEFELKQPFDPAKFKFTYSDVAGWSILNVVEYDGEDIDGSGGYSTTGKSSEYNFYYRDEEDSIETYNTPSDEDYGVPAFGPSPDDWEKSPKFKFKQHKPVHIGWYSCNWSYGSTYGSLYWNGENFVEFDYGKEHIVDPKGIVTWQGYNWDTSSWVNRPPEPIQAECPCGWTGNVDELTDAEEGPDMCPACASTEWNWIDYDPDTAKGRKNRAKHCNPWDPATALASIPVPEDFSFEDGVAALTQAVKELGQEIGAEEDTFDWSDDEPTPDYECVQCEWQGQVDECSYDDNDNMICPECGEPVELIEYNVKVNTNPWIDVKVTPAVEGQYEVKNTHTPVWPFPASFEATWNGKAWVDSDGDAVENVVEWRDL